VAVAEPERRVAQPTASAAAVVAASGVRVLLAPVAGESVRLSELAASPASRTR